MRIVSPPSADQQGFTLAELLVALALVGLISAGAVTLMVTGNKTYATGSKQIEAQQAARVALERMAREIRGAGYNPTGTIACPPTNTCPIVGNPGWGSPDATTLRIQSDTNANGVFDASEQVTYRLNGTNLERQVSNAAPQTIVAGIQALTFTYLNENGDGASQAQDIRSVHMSLTAQPEDLPGAWELGRVSVTMSDRVRLRNR
jgi:prepilin-type N-terminal cleavage/methylation domain-containing protein